MTWRGQIAPAPPPAPLPPLGERARAYLRGALFDNLGLKFVSLVLALTVFILVNTGQEREIVARVGVSYTLPDDKVLVSERVDAVRITVRGPKRLLSQLELDHGAVYIDAQGEDVGEHAVKPTAELPPGVTLMASEPATVQLVLSKGKHSNRVRH